MERWERELQQLKDVDAPASTRPRMAAGPTGDGMPPPPNRGQRVAAGVVACLVFLLGAALVGAAFRGGPDDPLVGAAPDVAVLTLLAEPNDAVASLAYRDATVDPVVDSYCWNQDNGAQRCADVAMAEPFTPSDYLSIPEGTSFALVNSDDADLVALTVSPGNDPYEAGAATTIDELGRLEPGFHVLTVTANWEGRGENVTFHFPVQVVVVEPTPTPTGSASPVPTSSPSMDPAGDPDRELERLLVGTSWQLSAFDRATLDLLEPPTLVFGAERAGGSTGCNRYGTDDWGIEGGRLSLREMGMTLALCPEGTGAIEERFLAILSGTPLVAVNDTNLGLSSDGGTMLLERIDVDHDDVVGSFLDCAVDDRVELRPPGGMDQPGPPEYFTVNLPWIEPTDELQLIAGSAELDEASRWVVIRDGLVIAEVDYPNLTGIACRSSGA